jgi:hypothetical protein
MPAAVSYRHISQHNLCVYFLPRISLTRTTCGKNHMVKSAPSRIPGATSWRCTLEPAMAGIFAALQVQVDVYGILFFCVPFFSLGCNNMRPADGLFLFPTVVCAPASLLRGGGSRRGRQSGTSRLLKHTQKLAFQDEYPNAFRLAHFRGLSVSQ